MRNNVLTPRKQSAQEFINVRDILGNYLYTIDNYIIGYVKVSPVRLELLSRSEKISLCDRLTTELSMDKDEWVLLAVSRPLDIYPIINKYMDLKDNTDNSKRKELLRLEIEDLKDYVSSGEVVERQFYFKLWQKMTDNDERDLQKRLVNFANKFESIGLRAEILSKPDIIRLCNLVHNPAYVVSDDTDISYSLPVIEDWRSNR